MQNDVRCLSEPVPRGHSSLSPMRPQCLGGIVLCEHMLSDSLVTNDPRGRWTAATESDMCSWKYSPLMLKDDDGVGRYIYGDGKLARPAIIVNDCNFIGLRRRMLLAMKSYMKLVQIAFK